MTGYESSQMMRRLETAIREQKGLKAAAKASGDNSLAKESNKVIQEYHEKYSEISQTTGIKEDKNRISYTKKLKIYSRKVKNFPCFFCFFCCGGRSGKVKNILFFARFHIKFKICSHNVHISICLFYTINFITKNNFC